MTGRPRWSGRRVTNALNHVWSTTPNHECWLCHHPTTRPAASIDHVLPVHTHPDLEWTPTNWRLAHRTQAGTPTGCQTHGCQCIGNLGRGTQPITAPPSRHW